MASNRLRYIPHPLPRLSKEERLKRRLESVKRSQLRRKLKGLCARCHHKVELGKSRCRPCLDLATERQRIYNERIGR